MIIRKFRTSDWERYKDCVLSQWEDSYVIDKDHRIWCYEYLDPFYHHNTFLFNSDYVVFVLVEPDEEGGEIVGFNIGKVYQEKMEIIALYVDPMYRSEGWGIGLKEALTEEARMLGLPKISALNRYDNPASLKLNSKLNWSIEHLNDDYYRATKYFN